MTDGNGRPTNSLRGSMFPQSIRQYDQMQKEPGRTVIAHISDLHFRSDTDAASLPWNALLADLTRREAKRVDVLAVTGDLVDSPFSGVFGLRDEATAAFARVCSYLEDLCAKLGIDPKEGLVVVPGNHDYRLSGLVRDRHAPRKFYDKFGAYCRPLLLPSLRLCLFAIDSNTMARSFDLAAGTVEGDDLVNFGTLIETMPAGHSDCTKVALLHHHPMPIAATENPSLFDDPSYTLLKNAGQFMTNMVRSGVSLVLHGHQHSAGYSKAVFPYGAKEHMITVVAAGSAGKAEPEYNLVTITDGGKIDLERRSLRAKTFFDIEGAERPLLSYDEARRLAFDGVAADAGAKFRVRKVSRLYFIHGGSGDADIYERSEQTETLGEDMATFDTNIESASGFFAKPDYTPVWPGPGEQQIKWVWKSEVYAPKREAQLVFEPPLAKGRPVTFEAQRKAYNLFHFYQRDREDATDGRWGQEFLELNIQNVYDLFVVTAKFPEGHWPQSFQRAAHNRRKCPNEKHDFDRCAYDPLETERFSLHFSKLKDAGKDAGTIIISLDRPLPGFTYWVYWNLPEEEASQLNAFDANEADAFEKELLRMRERKGTQYAAAQRWFDEMRKSIIKTEMWSSLRGFDDMEILLYAYDRERRGLVCVAASLQGRQAGGRLWAEVIKPGTTIVGASYRRKEAMLYCPTVKSPRLGESEYGMRIPESWREGEIGADDRYAVVCVVPLFYPIPDGRRIAVVAFASRSARSRLLHFTPQSRVGMDKEKLKAISAKHKALLEEVIVGQCKKLADALGVTPPPRRGAED